jgi:hypothetical protein
MSRRLRMSAEVGDWLAGLAGSDPLAAAEVSAALAAVLAAADPLSVPPVSVPDAEPAPDLADPRELADYAYQSLLEELQRLRRATAELAADREVAERHLRELEESGADPALVAELGLKLAATRQRENELAHRASRIQPELDAFRTAKETAKALYTAAEASRRVSAAIGAFGFDDDAQDATGGGTAGPSRGEDNLGELEQAVAAARERLTALAAQAAQIVRGVHIQNEPSGPGQSGTPHQMSGAEMPPGLLELRADPFASDVRVLFAAEPADTVTLLAVIEGQDAISEHWHMAIGLASELLAEIRSDGWPADTGELAFADAASFLAQYFPDRGEEIMRRSAALTRAARLRDLREQRGLSLADLAAVTGMSERELRELEADDPGSASVREVSAYLRALGGRLRVIAEFDGEQQILI